jgi:hypothetical protein
VFVHPQRFQCLVDQAAEKAASHRHFVGDDYNENEMGAGK